MDKRKITAFSKAAYGYDEYAWLQCQMWDELLQRLKYVELNPDYIVDIGMGTGEHTYELSEIYPNTFIVGLDIAWGMVKYASQRQSHYPKTPFMLQADLNEMPFRERSFDLAISNAVYQRAYDYKKAFLDVKRILRPKGLFCMSLFTKNTLWELHRSFERAYNEIKGPLLPRYNGQPTNSSAVKALKEAGFSIVSVAKFKRRPTYKSTYEILKWLKGIGANHYYENWIHGIEGRAVLREMDKIYRDRYSSNGKIFATFEGLIINARV